MSSSNETKEGDDTPSYDRWTLRDDSTIDYGYCSGGDGRGPTTTSTRPSFYLTTAINYTNGPAHMGHAYEAATSDVISRFQRWQLGPDPCFFLTGSDEHGQKIAETAAKSNATPISICDQYSTGFRVLNQRLLISNNDYVRTTSPRHQATARALWTKCAEDIYLDTYAGWYNVREETFVTDNEAALTDYVDPVSGVPYKKVQEESYFFRMSKYQPQLLEHLLQTPDFIRPPQYRNLILQRLQTEELRDLSISRTTFDWGIPVPEGFRQNHVMYVWMDALSNYLTGVDGLNLDPENDRTGFWPASVHIIGKDILWFHTVIWPCLLFSAGLPLPKTVFAHGFVNDKDGKKMSKSLGNVVDPHDILDRFAVDTFRWYLCKEAPYGGELAFAETSMRDMHNADLCDTLGNLVHRATSLCQKYCGGKVPDVTVDPQALPIADLAALVESYRQKMEAYELESGASIAMQAFRDINAYLQSEAPWHIKDDAPRQQRIVRTTLEALYAASHLLLPFLPIGSRKIFGKLHTEPVLLPELKMDYSCLTPGTTIDVGEILYERSVSEEEKAGANKKKESLEELQRKKREAKAKKIAASQQGQDDSQPDFTKLDIRVGQIVRVWHHDTADKLFCEEINVGEDAPREIASGLREHYSLAEMENKKVLVVCNLKAVKIQGFVSNGMVLAAKGDGATELIEPPADAAVGERVTFEGATGEPVSSSQVKKKKIWEAVSTQLKTTTGGVATWDGKQITTTSGVCKAKSLEGVPIS